MRFDTGRKTTVQRNGMCEFKVLFGYFFFQEKVTPPYSSVIRGSNFLYSTSTMTFITITMNENTSTQPCTRG